MTSKRTSVPVLTYHQVTPRPHPSFRKYSVTPRAFAAQMAWLAWSGHQAITLDSLLAARAGRGSLPRRPVVITFDDGFRDCCDYAVPVLRARGFSAVFFLVAGLVGRRSTWLLREKGVEFPLMDWPAARDLLVAGLECGAHSLSHPRLVELPTAECRRELGQSRQILADGLGHDVMHLAYPFGSYDERVRAIAAEVGYRSACSVRIGLSDPDDDALALHRVPVSGKEGLANFICRVRTGRAMPEVLRGRTRRTWGRVRRLAGLRRR
jgi:peptidoglycan/xylan/chitin deacetylase (PgdA/CDA1 family)